MSDTAISVSEPGTGQAGITLADLLQVSPDALARTLAGHVRQGQAEAGASSEVLRWLADEAAASVCGQLRVDVFALVFRAWAAIRELRDYADPRKHPPGETAILRWGRCSIKAPQGIDLNVKVAGLALPVLRLTVDLEAEFHSLALTLRDGAVRKATPGPAQASVALNYGKVPLVGKCKTPELSFEQGIVFEPGLPIGWSPGTPPAS